MDVKPYNTCQQSRLLWICAFLLTISLNEANYDFTVRFYEFRNPLGLQCDECGTSGGLPACCDDVQRRENCSMIRPFTCDTRFRFLLRPFGSSVDTVPNTGFPSFTPSSGDNDEIFTEGPNGLLGLPNPFIISITSQWTGRIQFFIDAVDRPVAMSTSGLNEILAIINRFPIDLELDPGTNFTERTTYTGIYNISGVGFDMSFRVQCADNFFGPNCCPEENFFGPNCTTFCEPVEGVYTCDREGRVVCLEVNRNPSTTCASCLPGFDPETSCTQCLSGRLLPSNCTQCPPGYDISSDCTTCLPGYTLASNGQQRCVMATTVETSTSTSTDSLTPAGANLRAVSGAIGALAILLIVVLVVLCVIIAVMVLRLAKQRQEKSIVSDEEEPTTPLEHDINNPLYGDATQDDTHEDSPKVDLGRELEKIDYETEDHQGGALIVIDEGEEGGEKNLHFVTVETEEPGPSLLAEVTGVEQSAADQSDQDPSSQPNDGNVAASNMDDPNRSGVPNDYADIAISSTAAPPESGAVESGLESTATYTNTTPGVITQEAINHYDFGQ